MKKALLAGFPGKVISTVALASIMFGSFAFALPSAALAAAVPADYFVTINKYVDGQQATAQNAQSADFPMLATYTINGTAGGPSPYALSANGYNGDPTPYQAKTGALPAGSNYSTNEDTASGNVVGTACQAGSTTTPQFALLGYTYGATPAEAQSAALSQTPPSFTNMASDEYVIVWNHDCSKPATVNVTVDKYVDGQPASASTTITASFPMTATWTADNIGSGSGSYTLSPTGYNSANAYEAVTADMTSGASYSTSEDTTGNVVSASCSAGVPYALTGYTTGNTMAEAASSTPSLVAPSFTGMTQNKYVIVWNHDCATTGTTTGTGGGTGTTTASTTVKVVISKYIDGQMATASSSQSLSFPMSATWTSTNYPSGTGEYTLSAGGFGSSTTPYQATTVDFNSGASYSTNEITSRSTVADSCSAGAPFSLVGYTTGTSMAAAASSTPTLTMPSFANMTSDEYVIVWNHACGTSGGISGTVIGSHGTLAVTSVDAVDTTATADNTYADGWKYVFHVTVPDNEQHVAMKFSDWTTGSTTPAGTFPAGGNMTLSSAQSDTASTTIPITAANTYSTPDFNMTGDLDPVMPGKQVQIEVDVKIPTGTVNGSFSTSFGIRSQP